MRKLLIFILTLSCLAMQAQETDSLEWDNISGHVAYMSKFRIRRPVNITNGTFYRFTDNPAYTGLEGKQNLNIGYYNKWPGLTIKYGYKNFKAPSGYFATYEVSLGKYKKSNLGVNFLRNQNGYHKGVNLGISYAYVMYFSRSSQLRLGANVGYFQRSINFRDLSFGDAYDPRYGYVFGTQEISPTPSVGYTDLSAGFWLKLRQLQLGGSVQSITRPDNGFLGLSRKPMVILSHAQYDWYASRKLTLSPYIQLKLSWVSTLTPGVAFSFMEKYMGGVSLQNMNVARAMFGYQLNRKYRLHIAGGLPLEKETAAMSGVAQIEGGFRYLFTFKKKQKDEKQD